MKFLLMRSSSEKNPASRKRSPTSCMLREHFYTSSLASDNSDVSPYVCHFCFDYT